MRIAILGAGAMGMLFGAYLSRENDVLLLDNDSERVDKINSDGIKIRENNSDMLFHAQATLVDSKNYKGIADLLIIFVKSMFEREALDSATDVIGSNTYLMTLQNGEGHEEVLRDFASDDHIIIGTTQDNSSIIGNGYINHGGAGHTYIGRLEGDSYAIQYIADNFNRCGFNTQTSDNVKSLIWNKLFLNASVSALTALFQTNLGFIVDDPYAWELAKTLIAEAVAVANADGYPFSVDTVTTEIKAHIARSKGGYTSIYADLQMGRKSEVDTISGAVVKAAERLGIEVPNMKFVVNAIHAMENKK